MSRTGYEPGETNMGAHPTRNRWLGAVVAIYAAVLLVAAVLTGRLPPWTLYLVGVPVTAAVALAEQARANFCVMYAMRHIYNFVGSGGGPGQIPDPDAQQADIARAKQLVLRAVLAGIATTAAVVGGYRLL